MEIRSHGPGQRLDQNGAHRIGRSIKLYDEVEAICLDQFVVFQNTLDDGDLMTCSQGQMPAHHDRVERLRKSPRLQYRFQLHRAPESLSGALASLLAFPWSPPYSRRVRPEVRFLAVSSSRSLPSSAGVITELSATSDPRFSTGSESTNVGFGP
jgi:hypothetical protein